MVSDLELLSINTVRTLAMDAVQRAASGHPGMPMGAAPMAYVLFAEAMRYDPTEPEWHDRDRFILSAGHGSMLLYAFLHLAGYERPSVDDLRTFRQWGSPTAGHPEHDELPGVETTTGPLGQGFANGVGMAIAEAKLAAEFNRPDHTVVDHRVYAIVSDGDLMEGVTNEAASLAGHLRLGKLIYLYDDNGITIDGSTDQTFSEDVLGRFGALGWHTERVADGTDLDAIRDAVKRAQDDDRPSLIAVRTVIGHGSALAGSERTHGAPLGEDEVAIAKRNLGWDPDVHFHIPDEVRAHLDARERGSEQRADWERRVAAYREAYPDLARELDRRLRGDLPDGWREAMPRSEVPSATRKSAGKALDAFAAAVPELFGGSADLAGSNVSEVSGSGVFSADDRLGRNLRFGVREHAMAAVCNGIALHGGFIPYGATFLIFTDYARPAIRLSALMRQRVVWIMTHDSVGLGEDGPTHQPVEHLASLRAMPNLHVVRPADGNEAAQAWAAALDRRDGPTLLALTRQDLPDLGGPPADAVERGAWTVRDADGTPDVVLIGTGSEVQHCLGAADLLAAEGVGARVVSMPCWERFATQDAGYRDRILPPDVTARVAVEAAATFGWERWVGPHGRVVGLDRFGASAPGDVLMERFGFTAENVAAVAREVLGR